MLLSPARAAKELGVGRDELYRLLHAGTVVHIRVGRRYKVPQWALEEYIRRAVNDLLANGRAATTKEGE